MKNTQIGRIVLLLAGALLCRMPLGACTELSLQNAIDLALSQNTSLRITQKGEESAEAAYRSAKGGNSFSVTASSSLETNKTEGNSHVESSSNRLSASLPLYSGGKNQAAIESSEIGIKSAELKTERQREDLKLNVIQAYYNAVQAKKTIAVRQEAVDNYNAHYTNVNQLYSAGSKARVDVLRASVELSNARYELIHANNVYEVRLATLRDYLNIDRNEPLELTEEFSYNQFAVPLTDCMNYAYGHRKDLLIDLYSLEQKELAVKIAKAGFLPNVNLSLGTQFSGITSPSWDMEPSVSAGVSASWNIFDSGVTRAKVDTAETERDIARLTFDKDREAIDLKLREAYYNMRGAEHQLQSTADAVGQAEEDYYIAREKYRAGEGIMLDVLDAQKSLSEARLNHITAQYDYMRYKAAVENAMGIGLTEGERAAAEQLSQQPMKVLDPSVAVREMEKKIASPLLPSADTSSTNNAAVPVSATEQTFEQKIDATESEVTE